MNGKVSKLFRKQVKQQVRVNAQEAWEIVMESIKRQGFIVRVKIAWRIVQGKL